MIYSELYAFKFKFKAVEGEPFLRGRTRAIFYDLCPSWQMCDLSLVCMSFPNDLCN